MSVSSVIAAATDLNALEAENAYIRRQLQIIADNRKLRAEALAAGIDVAALGQVTSLSAVAERIAAKFTLRMVDLRGASRERYVVWPRQEAFWESYEVRCADSRRRYSLPQIGRFYGGRDHTTVLHGVRAHAKRMGLA